MLTQCLTSDPSLVATEKFACETETTNLTPCAGQILGPNEVAEGGVYAATLKANDYTFMFFPCLRDG